MATGTGYTWKVEYQTETVGVGPDGRPTEGVKVGFVTAAGVHASVFVPKAQFNAANVKAAISAAYAHHSDVSGLSG